MALLNWVFEQPAWERLTLTLLHSLWQGALLAVLLWIALRLAPAGRTGLRYTMSVTALAGLVVSCAVTHALLAGGSTEGAPVDQRGVVVATDPASKTVWVGPASLVPPSPVAPSSSSTSSPGTDAPEARWPMGVGVGWMIGALLMLLRALVVLHAAGRLRRAAIPLTEPWVLDLLADLCGRMRIRRRVELLVCEQLRVPGVVGAFWPAILIPPAVLADLSPAQVRLILAHELAHVRRHDFFVNVVQLLIEAALFFNPAMWWMSRQVRIEREARCDQAAAALAPQPSDYARTLADIVLRLVPSREPALVAMSGEGDAAGLLMRAERLLRPQRRPRVAVPWHGMIGVMLAGLIVLGGLWEGTHVAVAAAKSIRLWTAEERVLMARAIEGPSDLTQFSLPPVKLQGIVTAPGIHTGTIGLQVEVRQHGASGGYSSVGAQTNGNRFYCDVFPGEVSAIARLQGEVVAVSAPIRIEPGAEPGQLTLAPYTPFKASVLVRDADHRPVKGAKVYGGSRGAPERLLGQTDGHGMLTLPRCDGEGWVLRAVADGYLGGAQTDVRLRPDQTVALTLNPAARAAGVVIDRDTGRPVAGAAIKIVFTAGQSTDPTTAPIAATTDQRGRFDISGLSLSGAHVWVEAPRHAPTVASLSANQTDARIVLGPEFIVTGELKGEVSQFFLGFERDIIYTLVHRFGGHQYRIHGTTRLTTNDQGKDVFRIPGLNAGELVFWLRNRRHRFMIRGPEEHLVVEAPPALLERKVILRLHPPAGSPPVEGSVTISSTNALLGNDIQDDRPRFTTTVPVVRGEVTFLAPVGAQLVTDSIFVKTPGYVWELKNCEVGGGDDPLIVEVPAEPAGTIAGRVVSATGSPLDAVEITLLVDPPMQFNGTIRPWIGISTRLDGSFSFHGLPLGRKYSMFLQSPEGSMSVAPWVLDQRMPIMNLPLMLQPGHETLRGRVLDADGQPVSGGTVSLYHQMGDRTFRGGTTTTDWAGFYTFNQVSEQVPGPRTIEVAARPGWQPERVRVEPDDPPPLIRIQRGRVVRGVIQTASGVPVYGAKVVARRPGEGWPIFADAPTDARGEFVFTSLGDGVWDIAAEFSDWSTHVPNWPVDPDWTIDLDAAPQPLILTLPE